MLSLADIKFRITVIFMLFFMLYIVIILNLYNIQMRNTIFYTQLGQQQYYGLHTHAPPRGLIYDRNGTLLTLNQDCLSAFVLPKQLKDAETTLLFLKKYFPQAYRSEERRVGKECRSRW